MKKLPSLSTIIKIAVVLLVIREVWLLLQVPSIAEAVISFVMIGKVPGTETTLSPDAMIRVLIVTFVVISSLIFRKELTKLIRWMFRRPQVKATPIVSVQQVKTPIAHPHKVMARSKTGMVHNHLSQLKARVLQWAAKASKWTDMTATAIAIRAGRVGAVVFWRTQRLARYIWRVLVITYMLLTILVAAAWSWLKPHIQKFDRWIERRLHQNEHTAAILAVARDVRRNFRKWVEEARAYEPEKTENKPTNKEPDPAE